MKEKDLNKIKTIVKVTFKDKKKGLQQWGPFFII